MPKKCPVCGSEAKRIDDEVARRCTNKNCPAQIKGRLEHWVSRNAMDIKGIGGKLLDKLIQKDLIKTVTDLYTLKKDELIDIERMGEKSTENILEEIKDSKDRGLERVIYGLAIKYVGEYVAHILTENFSSIDNLMKATEEDLDKIDNIGPEIAKSIVNFFYEEDNKKMISNLKDIGIKMKIEKDSRSKQFLDGKKFVLTGALDKYTRDEATKEIQKYGGRVTSSVSSETDYVVVGENPGSKLDNAKKLEIPIIKEEEFLKILKNKKLKI